ncbi:proline-rich protein 2-like [Motacilla alba alba]|uniref:proline-rich protein 2-like n=1 Tax=Motacilla alba alba TaxID=1094192 RepID=UPI0018D58BFA|nr:proline-rich protein 2-like [Motacilla alba alba]
MRARQRPREPAQRQPGCPELRPEAAGAALPAPAAPRGRLGTERRGATPHGSPRRDQRPRLREKQGGRSQPRQPLHRPPGAEGPRSEPLAPATPGRASSGPLPPPAGRGADSPHPPAPPPSGPAQEGRKTGGGSSKRSAGPAPPAASASRRKRSGPGKTATYTRQSGSQRTASAAPTAPRLPDPLVPATRHSPHVC